MRKLKNILLKVSTSYDFRSKYGREWNFWSSCSTQKSVRRHKHIKSKKKKYKQINKIKKVYIIVKLKVSSPRSESETKMEMGLSGNVCLSLYVSENKYS